MDLKPDLSIPDLPVPTPPKTNAQGQFVGMFVEVIFRCRQLMHCPGTPDCLAMFPDPEPPIPFGEQTRENSLIIENGFKASDPLPSPECWR